MRICQCGTGRSTTVQDNAKRNSLAIQARGSSSRMGMCSFLSSSIFQADSAASCSRGDAIRTYISRTVPERKGLESGEVLDVLGMHATPSAAWHSTRLRTGFCQKEGAKSSHIGTSWLELHRPGARACTCTTFYKKIQHDTYLSGELKALQGASKRPAYTFVTGNKH